MKKISVIVPVYKVEAYLDRCVQSIVNQSYRNLEIILVDDGSPDRCPEMCESWAKKDPRIRVIHKKNGGLSDARNAGMAVATGAYIAFLDSDDWIQPNMYELLLQRIKEDHSDISACGVEMFWEDGSREPCMLTPAGTHVLNHKQAMSAILQESLLKQPVWYKLYRADLIRDLLFPVGKYHEDAFWSYLAIARANRVSVFDAPCYHYAQRKGSIMGESYSLRRLDSLEAKELQLQYMKEHLPEFISLSHENLLSSCLYAAQMSLRYMKGKEKQEALKRISQTFSNNDTTLPDNLSIKQRIWLSCAKISLRGAARVRNCLGIGF